MSTFRIHKSEFFLSTRRIGVASLAAVLGCAACGAIPFLVTAGVGGGAVATLASVFRPGTEPLVGGAAFVVALAAMGIRNRLKRRSGSARGTSCDVEGTCRE